MADGPVEGKFTNVLVSSPGKIILYGEHAVVYGKAAIAASVDLRCYLLMSPVSSGNIDLTLPGMNNFTQSWTVKELVELKNYSQGGPKNLLQSLKRLCDITSEPSMQSLACLVMLYLLTRIFDDQLQLLPGLRIFCYSQLPFGAGLGSSAAYSVCIATGLMCLCGHINEKNNKSTSCPQFNIPDVIKAAMEETGLTHHVGIAHDCVYDFMEEDLKIINKWGYEAETLVHGSPSGIDNSISVFGGAIKFKEGIFEQLEKMPSLSIILVYTKVPRSTKKMVSGVKERYDAYPAVIKPILNSIEEIVLKSEEVLEKLFSQTDSCNDSLFKELQDMLTINHHLLNAIGVGHPSLDKIHHVTLNAGLGSKLTGGGGGGCAFILIPSGISTDTIEGVVSQLEAFGFDCWQTCIGGKGVATYHIN